MEKADKAFDEAHGNKSNLVMQAMSMQNNPFFNLLLRQSGQGDVSELASRLINDKVNVNSVAMQAQLSGKDVLQALQNIADKIEKTGRPNISVNTATPLEDTLKIVGGINRI